MTVTVAATASGLRIRVIDQIRPGVFLCHRDGEKRTFPMPAAELEVIA